MLYTLLGQQVLSYAINAGKTELHLPINLSAGMYMGVFKPADGSASKEVKIMYQP